LKVFESDLLRVVHQAFDFKEVLLRIYLRDTTVVSDEMVLVRGDFSLSKLTQAYCAVSSTCLDQSFLNIDQLVFS
jgi:hypothetical protein